MDRSAALSALTRAVAVSRADAEASAALSALLVVAGLAVVDELQAATAVPFLCTVLRSCSEPVVIAGLAAFAAVSPQASNGIDTLLIRHALGEGSCPTLRVKMSAVSTAEVWAQLQPALAWESCVDATTCLLNCSGPGAGDAPAHATTSSLIEAAAPSGEHGEAAPLLVGSGPGALRRATAAPDAMDWQKAEAAIMLARACFRGHLHWLSTRQGCSENREPAGSSTLPAAASSTANDSAAQATLPVPLQAILELLSRIGRDATAATVTHYVREAAFHCIEAALPWLVSLTERCEVASGELALPAGVSSREAAAELLRAALAACSDAIAAGLTDPHPQTRFAAAAAARRLLQVARPLVLARLSVFLPRLAFNRYLGSERQRHFHQAVWKELVLHPDMEEGSPEGSPEGRLSQAGANFGPTHSGLTDSARSLTDAAGGVGATHSAVQRTPDAGVAAAPAAGLASPARLPVVASNAAVQVVARPVPGGTDAATPPPFPARGRAAAASQPPWRGSQTGLGEGGSSSASASAAARAASPLRASSLAAAVSAALGVPTTPYGSPSPPLHGDWSPDDTHPGARSPGYGSPGVAAAGAASGAGAGSVGRAAGARAGTGITAPSPAPAGRSPAPRSISPSAASGTRSVGSLAPSPGASPLSSSPAAAAAASPAGAAAARPTPPPAEPIAPQRPFSSSPLGSSGSPSTSPSAAPALLPVPGSASSITLPAAVSAGSAAGPRLVAAHIDRVAAYYCSQLQAGPGWHWEVQEAACNCAAELALKIDHSAVLPHVRPLCAALLRVAAGAEDWRPRDVAVIALGRFANRFPEAFGSTAGVRVTTAIADAPVAADAAAGAEAGSGAAGDVAVTTESVGTPHAAADLVTLQVLHSAWLARCFDVHRAVRDHAAAVLGEAVLAAATAPPSTAQAEGDTKRMAAAARGRLTALRGLLSPLAAAASSLATAVGAASAVDAGASGAATRTTNDSAATAPLVDAFMCPVDDLHGVDGALFLLRELAAIAEAKPPADASPAASTPGGAAASAAVTVVPGAAGADVLSRSLFSRGERGVGRSGAGPATPAAAVAAAAVEECLPHACALLAHRECPPALQESACRVLAETMQVRGRGASQRRRVQ